MLKAGVKAKFMLKVWVRDRASAMVSASADSFGARMRGKLNRSQMTRSTAPIHF